MASDVRIEVNREAKSMIERRRLIGLGPVLLYSMAAAALGKEPRGAADSLDPECGYVFAGSSAQRLVNILIGSEDRGGTWDPDSAQIIELESALTQELRRRLSALPGTAFPRPRVRDYYRQYAGIFLKGQKLIVINGFYKSHVEYTTAWLAEHRSEAELAAFPAEARNKNYWHFVPVVVLDGGEHYFDAFYDPAHNRISNFEFHGYA